MSFAGDINRFIQKTGAKQADVFEKTTGDLFGAIVLDTPVDEGQLKGDWQCTLNAPAEGHTGIFDKTGSQTINAIMAKLAQIRDWTNFKAYLTNNMPYVNRIEYDGHSQKAPQGMARRNVANFQKFFRQAVK